MIMSTKKYQQLKDLIRIILTGSIFMLLMILILVIAPFAYPITIICVVLSVLILISWIIIKTIGNRFSGNADLVWFPVSFREIPDNHESTESETQNIKNHV